MLRNSMVVLNGKGGVLKTTLAAQLSGLAALSGWRVLVVDLDQQANLARDLGYAARSDGGRGLFRAVAFGEPLEPIKDVRPGLDVIAGGPELNNLYNHLMLERGSSVLERFASLGKALAGLSSSYDLILFDSPPGGVIHYEALTAAHYVVIPTQPDQGSIDGLATVFRTLVEVRQVSNPDVTVLGAALGPIATNATRLRKDAMTKLERVAGQHIHVFETVVRAAQPIAVACREDGLLVHEYERAAAEATPWYRLSKDERHSRRNWSTSSTGLSEDYSRLASEILGRFTELRQVEAAQR